METVKITSFTADGLEAGLVTDTPPRFSFTCEGDVTRAVIRLDGCEYDAKQRTGVTCEGWQMRPFTTYMAVLTVTGAQGTEEKSLTFRTGRLSQPWVAQWITDGAYNFTEKKVSPKVMVFRRRIAPKKPLARAEIYATAMGVYELTLNGSKVGERYFAPGFTSYAHDLQYQVYDVTDRLTADSVLTAEVAGGWAVGSFVFTRANRISAQRQALLLEVRLTYTDGSEEVIPTDANWEVSTDGPVRMADLYDGETYDGRMALEELVYHPAAVERLRLHPRISADCGLPVVRHERFEAQFMGEINGRLIFDFGQNFAGVVCLGVKGHAGQTVRIRHAEILQADGDLNTAFLRSAKATLTYICREGEQTYAPRFTYMGFRYVSVEGAALADVTLTAYALYSDVGENGAFACSDDLLNKLNENIRWGAKSNFVDIPTDCPQRDERMGWTGDIAVFAPTACYNFHMRRFLDKWLRDLRSEQLPSGGLPNTIPAQSFGFPTTMPTLAVDFWGDACVLVPWALYMATGDLNELAQMYDAMERYVKACAFWARLGSVGKRRYIWHTPSMLHFGDWVAPDAPKMSQWQKRSKWTATASLCNTSSILAKVSALLGYTDKAQKYAVLSQKVGDAYQNLLMDSEGRLKSEFQTGYVLPLYFGMLDEKHRRAAAANLAKLVRGNDYCIGTGFPGTPYILFALADNGYADVAYRMLLNTRCPSWLHEVKVGATTVWERWDGLNENGECPIGEDGTGGMISYNHYASGAVGDFLYRRVLGIEALTGGYKAFAVKPLIGGNLTWAKGEVTTAYGRVKVDWRIAQGRFAIHVTVPNGSECRLTLPSGETRTLGGGSYALEEIWKG